MEDQEIAIKEESDEIEPLKMAPDPGQPTMKQLEQHRTCGHVPFRTWCKWCNMGRGRGHQHRAGAASTIALIGLDYFYITEGGLKRRKELEFTMDDAGDAATEEARKKGEIIKCIVVRCTKSKVVLGHVVPCKGADEDDYVSRLIADDLNWFGYVAVILKSDNEPALQALVTRVIEIAKIELKDLEKLSREEPAKYDSQSNGATEVGVMLLRGLFRTIKLCLEARLGGYVPITHAVIPWLLEHTALILNTAVRGEDGLTPWTRVRGRPFGQQMLGFCEGVLHKIPGKGPQHNPDGNMGTRWRESIFVGYSRTSNVYMTINEDGLHQARSIKRRPIDDRWRPDDVAAITVTPWSERVRVPAEVRLQAPREPQGPDQDVAPPPQPRGLRINQSDIDKFGYTGNCPQCAFIQRNGRARPGGKHSYECRTRIIEAIRASDAGRERVEEHETRVDRAIAERIERADMPPRPLPPQPERVQPAGGEGRGRAPHDVHQPRRRQVLGNGQAAGR